MENSYQTVTKFTGENWITWKFQVMVILKAKNVYDIVTGTKKRPVEPADEWDKLDAKAQEIIVTRMEENPLIHLLPCKTSHEMWEKLLSVYEKKSKVSIHLLQQRFFALETKGENISVFISRLEEIRSQLRQMGEDMSESMFITKILMSLPEKLKHFIPAWESTAVESQTVQELTSRLLIEEERINSTETVTALTSNVVNKKNKQSHPQAGNQGIKCFVCNKTGHIAKNCFLLKKISEPKKEQRTCFWCKKPGHIMANCRHKNSKPKEEKEKSKEETEGNAFIGETFALNWYKENEQEVAFVGGQPLSESDWCMDSGASEHMCNNMDLFEDYSEATNKREVKIGDGTFLKIHGVGTVKLKAWNGHEWIETRISEVLFVPELKINLFSLGCALDKNYKMHSDNSTCKLINKNGKVCAIAKRHGKLYKMIFKTNHDNFKSERVTLNACDKENNAVCKIAVETITNWHKKLAHQNYNHIRKFLTNKNIKFKEDVSQDTCKDCLVGKQHRSSNPSSNSRASRTCELIHGDVCGPMETPSLGGARYFLLLKDDYSSYRYVFFIQHKTEVKQKIAVFLKMAENITGNKVKTLRTDNGLEFINQELQYLLEENGICHQRSVVYTPQQNGRAEREMRTVVEAARTMLHSKGMSKVFWAEAVNTAVFVLNRTGSSPQTKSTPFELWYSKEVDTDIFKVFGSRVAAHIPKEKRLKLDAKSKEGLFVGYSENIKGYRVYFPQDKKIEVLKDIIFLQERGEVEKKTSTITLLENKEEDEEYEPENEFEEQEDEGLNHSEQRDDGSSNEDFASCEEREDLESRYSLRDRKKLNKPSRYTDYESSFLSLVEEDEPQTYNEAISSKESKMWKRAMKCEIEALEENDTWTVVEKPSNCEIVDSKWVFKKKKNEKGDVIQYKARLVARGFKQKIGSFSDFYSPVAKLATVRIFLAICNHLKIPVLQMDVCNAFLHGRIDSDVYMSVPQGFNLKINEICKLKKTLYGLKESPKGWNNRFHEIMTEQGFVRSEYDYCLYVNITKSGKIFLLLYVDDLLLAGTDKQGVLKIKSVLNNYFKMKDFGNVKHFLGIVIEQNVKKGEIILNQSKYLENIIAKYNMEECNATSTPMEVNFKHETLKREKSESEELEHRCRKLIGTLMYVMLCTRPDLCNAISILSRYQSCASEELWRALKRVLRYIKGTINLSLVYRHNETENDRIIGFVDSDWAGDSIDRRSTAGYVFKIFNCSVSWISRKQPTVALSSTEAEYMAMSLAASEACWLRFLYKDFNIQEGFVCVKLYEDNQSAIRVSKNPEFHKRLKHIDIKHHFVKEKVRENAITVTYINTNEQVADILTKPLGKSQFIKLRKVLGVF